MKIKQYIRAVKWIFTNEWDIVLDFTAGSFTTAIACENTNRKRICIEKDEWYYNIWIERVNGDTK